MTENETINSLQLAASFACEKHSNRLHSRRKFRHLNSSFLCRMRSRSQTFSFRKFSKQLRDTGKQIKKAFCSDVCRSASHTDSAPAEQRNPNCRPEWFHSKRRVIVDDVCVCVRASGGEIQTNFGSDMHLCLPPARRLMNIFLTISLANSKRASCAALRPARLRIAADGRACCVCVV